MFRLKLVLFSSALVLLGCDPLPDEGNPNAPTPPKKPVLSAPSNQSAHAGEGHTPLDGNETDEESATLKLALKVNFVEAPVTSPSYEQVKDMFSDCLVCHGGSIVPDLSSFPFVGNTDESLDSVLKKISQRMNDSSSPMPPSGLMPLESRQKVDAWIAAGAPKSHDFMEGVAFKDYAVQVQWKQSDSAWGPLMSVQNSGSQAMAANLGKADLSKPLSIRLQLSGPSGAMILSQDFASINADSQGLVSLAVNIVPEDVSEPVDPLEPADEPPVAGSLQVEAVSDEGLRLALTSATDDQPQDQLVYQLFQSKKPNIKSVEDMEASGEAIGGPQKFLPSLDVDGLKSHKEYFFNVIVSDQNGNKTAYKMVSGVTSGPVELQLEVRFVKEPATSVGFSDVKGVFTNCVGCHSGGISPNLSTFPFTGKPGQSIEQILAAVTSRMNSEDSPMPPKGLLDGSLRKKVDEWISAGGAGAHLQPAQAEGIDLTKYSIEVRTRLEGESWASWSTVDHQGSLVIGLPLGSASQGQRFEAEMIVKGPSGNVLLKDAMSPLAMDPKQSIHHVLNVVAEDEVVEPTNSAPVVGTLTLGEITDRSLSLTFTEASDDQGSADLRYQLFSSNDSKMETLEEVLTKGLAVGLPKPFDGARNLKGLIPNTGYFFSIVVTDSEGLQAAYPTATVTSTDPEAEDYNIHVYGQECAERLGTLKPFSCLEDGQIIPIQVNGEVPDSYPSFAEGGTQELDCDKPALLGLGSDGRCAPYTRLGRLDSYDKNDQVMKDVDTTFICRRYDGREGKWPYQGEEYEGKDFPAFEDVAIIQHNSKTGETCWFQMLAQSTPKDARRVPPPTEVELPTDAPDYALSALEFWLSPESTADIDCLSCHDSDPWIHSPYVDQVKGVDGKPLVPSHTFGPYKMIGRKYFSDWLQEDETSRTRSYSVDTKEGNSCTSCHRIGDRNTCDSFARQSVGMSFPPNISDYAKETFAVSHWMPPGSITEDQWNQGDWQKQVDELLACCADPDADGCVQKPVNSAPPVFHK